MIKNFARTVIVIIVLISAGSIYMLPQLEFDYNFESFFPTDDPDLKFYLEFRKVFEPDNDFILIAIERDKGIFDIAFLQKVSVLSDSLSNLENVKSVISPTNIRNPVIDPFGVITFLPYLHLKNQTQLLKDSVRVYSADNLVGSFFSKDAKALTISVQSKPLLSKILSDELLFDIQNEIGEFDFDNVRIAGRIAGQHYIIEKMKYELLLFISISIFILILVLFFAFRSAWGVWVPLLTVLLSAVWLLAFMVVTDQPMNLVTILLPTILFVVGVSDIVHILSKYLEELRLGTNKIIALKKTFREVGFATLLTSVTTAIGFLTLLSASIKPIQVFGIYTAIGVLLAFILAFTLLPAVLVLQPKPKIALRSFNEVFWHRILYRIYIYILRNRKVVLVGAILLVLISLWGISRIEINNYLLEDLKDKDPHKQDFVFFENKFAGARPFEMAVWVKDSTISLLDYEVLHELDKVEDYLTNQYNVGFIVSPLTIVKTANKALNGGHEEAYQLPDNQREYVNIMRVVRMLAKGQRSDAYLENNQRMGRISAKMEDIGGANVRAANEKFRQFVQSEIDTSLIGYRMTGTALLIDKNNEYLADNMVEGLLIAFGIIALIVGLLYQSFAMVVIAIIPNMFPLLMIGGLMGFSGIDLKVSTSIIFTIAFGIAVDDTIHFLSKLKLELNKGKPLLYAIKRTYVSTGKAIVVTSVILFSGFMTLIFSNFTGTFYIGLLIGFTLMFAVFADLILLPVLLLLFYRPKRR